MKTIIIDPGHGGNDNGAEYGGLPEDEVNLSISLMLHKMLTYEGFKASLTRATDEYVSLKDRVKFANELKADFFISIHCDAWHNESTKGISTHIYTKPSLKSVLMGIKIQDNLMLSFGGHVNRGLKRSNFYVLRETACPAALVECEFISNPSMRDFLRQESNQYLIAQSLTLALKGGGL